MGKDTIGGIMGKHLVATKKKKVGLSGGEIENLLDWRNTKGRGEKNPHVGEA